MSITRADRVAQINDLLREGRTPHEIADILGIARSTVRNYIADPDGSRNRSRRESYGRAAELRAHGPVVEGVLAVLADGTEHRAGEIWLRNDRHRERRLAVFATSETR